MGGAGKASALPNLGWRGTTSLDPQQEASRFLAQATFGGDRDLIDEVVTTGLESWLDDQLALPANPTLPDVQALVAANPGDSEVDLYLYFDWVWWQRAMTAPDLVRHRVAFALSQIFVVSRREDTLFDSGDGMASYHDVLLRNAFGNARDLLLEVALHPMMGVYLSHALNRRSDPSLNRFPDENFAREVMQLFSIGLFELHPYGSQVLDGEGQPIPTYSNAEITEMAKIFTGLTFAPEEPGDPIEWDESDNLVDPMAMFEPEHEPGPKTLIGGVVVPAGQTGMEDIEAAIDVLFDHPNLGPFLGRQLIQRLVTSNPSPAYIARISAVFADNGSGVRGDLAAVIRAILLDPEARDSSRIDDPTFGKVREPIIRWIQLGRAFHLFSETGLFRHFGGTSLEDEDFGELEPMAQYPYFSPSVFNFFSPFHQPAGGLVDAGLVSPEMEIIHSYTSIATINMVDRAIFQEHHLSDQDDPLALDLDTEDAIEDPVALVDHLDLLLTYGTLSAASRQTILDAILPIEDSYDRAMLALYLLMISPDYAVQR